MKPKSNDKFFVLVNPQWQGGGDPVTYFGAKELERLYLQNGTYFEISTEIHSKLQTENEIVGYTDIQRQMRTAAGLLREKSPARIFSIGGGCDADVPVIAYLNKRYDGNLLVLWLDAHGDMNAPQESETGLFYGMPVRALMSRELFGDIVERPLKPQQILNIGGRDFDEPEVRYLRENPVWHSSQISLNTIQNMLDARKESFLYVHLDLDVLDPEEFPHTPLPVAGGASGEEILTLLKDVKKRNFVGLGVYEYAPCGKKMSFIEDVFDEMMEQVRD